MSIVYLNIARDKIPCVFFGFAFHSAFRKVATSRNVTLELIIIYRAISDNGTVIRIVMDS